MFYFSNKTHIRIYAYTHIHVDVKADASRPKMTKQNLINRNLKKF